MSSSSENFYVKEKRASSDKRKNTEDILMQETKILPSSLRIKKREFDNNDKIDIKFSASPSEYNPAKKDLFKNDEKSTKFEGGKYLDTLKDSADAQSYSKLQPDTQLNSNNISKKITMDFSHKVDKSQNNTSIKKMVTIYQSSHPEKHDDYQSNLLTSKKITTLTIPSTRTINNSSRNILNESSFKSTQLGQLFSRFESTNKSKNLHNNEEAPNFSIKVKEKTHIDNGPDTQSEALSNNDHNIHHERFQNDFDRLKNKTGLKIYKSLINQQKLDEKTHFLQTILGNIFANKKCSDKEYEDIIWFNKKMQHEINELDQFMTIRSLKIFPPKSNNDAYN